MTRLLVIIVVAGAAAAAAAAPCPRQCAAEQRDARGCCPQPVTRDEPTRPRPAPGPPRPATRAPAKPCANGQECTQQCDRDHGASCSRLAELGLAALTSASPRVRTTAPALLGKACDAGVAEGCRGLAMWHLGRSGQRDVKQAAPYLERACNAKAASGRACRELAELYIRGAELGTDLDKAYKLVTRGCDASDGQACVLRGNALRDGKGAGKDEAAALAAYDKACHHDAVAGCVEAGTRYLRGIGTIKDETRAAGLFYVGCEIGDPAACTSLGRLYLTGTGVQRDAPRAATTLERACTRGSQQACAELGGMYLDGVGVAADAGKGMRLLETACEQKVGRGCTLLGIALLDRRQGERARQLLAVQCSFDDDVACFYLGEGYRRGAPDWTADPKRANAHFAKACRLGEARACIARSQRRRPPARTRRRRRAAPTTCHLEAARAVRYFRGS